MSGFLISVPAETFRRHDNCTCTVTFEQGAFRQDVWSKRSWEAPEVGKGAPKPKVFSKEEADRLEQERSAQYRGLTSGSFSGKIKEKAEMAGKEVHEVGRIDIEKFKKIANGSILTDEVIITDNRIEHIIERRGQQFFNDFNGYFAEILEQPDYIFKDEKVNTAIVSKAYLHKGKIVNIILRLVVEGDDPNYKNSIITAIGENEKRFAQRLRNNIPVYKKVDKSE